LPFDNGDAGSVGVILVPFVIPEESMRPYLQGLAPAHLKALDDKADNAADNTFAYAIANGAWSWGSLGDATEVLQTEDGSQLSVSCGHQAHDDAPGCWCVFLGTGDIAVTPNALLVDDDLRFFLPSESGTDTVIRYQFQDNQDLNVFRSDGRTAWPGAVVLYWDTPNSERDFALHLPGVGGFYLPLDRR
jgi:hypothetical protein